MSTAYKLLDPNCRPYLGSEEAAGIDLRANSREQFIEAGKEYHFSTGVAFTITRGWVGLVFPRSGLGCKYKLRLCNTVGVIDSDYRGEVKVICTFEESFWLEAYERIAQMVVVPCDNEYTEVPELDDTLRGAQGFGASGRT